jgi:hypothetical protein
VIPDVQVGDDQRAARQGSTPWRLFPDSGEAMGGSSSAA